MFDRIVIKAKIDVNDVDTIVLRNYLEQCSEGDEVFYKSTAYSRFDGVTIEIRGDTMKCGCSICKLWSKGRTGKLDNSRPMTFAMAVRTIGELLLRLSVKAENAVVTYYEVGLTMKMRHPPDDYIRQMMETSGRVLWVDANYSPHKQKTTEKSKYIRKVMKVYDKTFEAGGKGRKVEDNVLRIETVYRHQSVPMLEFTDRFFLSKTGRTFYRDWSEIEFVREMSGMKGVKMSQLEKAREVRRIGVTRYKERYREMYRNGKLTKKQWETMREFADNWKTEREKYVEVTGELEAEFKEKLLSGFQTGNSTPFKKIL